MARSSGAQVISCRTGLERGLEHRIGARGGGGIDHRADAAEQERHAVELAELAAVLAEQRAHVGGGAVAVVGQRLDDERHAARCQALVAHLVVGYAFFLPAAAADRALDIFLRHVHRARGENRGAQARVRVGVRALARGDHDLAHELAEQPGALLILRALAVHDVGELRMAGHGVVSGCWRRNRRRQMDRFAIRF
jgi:hypothetical protein